MTYLKLVFRFVPILALCIIAPSFTFGAVSKGRERILFDTNWKFHLGNDWGTAENLSKSGSSSGPAVLTFGDASWSEIDLPHDWAISLPFDKSADASHGFKALGENFPQNSVGWYRRVFDLPGSDSGRRLWLEFDGVFRNATVFFNGWALAHHESGYNSFRIDITDIANCGGKNIVAVRVDATQPEGWFYEGAGIYRHVWLVKTGPIAIAPDSVFVYSELSDLEAQSRATVHFESQIENHEETAAAAVQWEVIAPDGQIVAETAHQGSVGSGQHETWSGQSVITHPQLWSPETPALYKLRTTLFDSHKLVIDQIETSFGVRSFAFDADKGFLLNGKPYLIKGTCNHQDHAGVGAAIPDKLQEFRVKKLKEMGSNAYRTAHNPPTPELLDACDRLGMIVMDENRLIGSDEQHLSLLEEMIRRDRNHASVAIWSLGNEEFSTGETPAGARVAETMQQRIKQLDPTRPITYNAPVGNTWDGINGVIEVRGWSYHIGKDSMDAYHAAHPKQPNVGSEQGSTVGTRGIYTVDPERGYVTAYDDNGQSWSNTAEQWLTFFDSRPWLSGGFVWTGFDYRGEPTPYNWPCINSHFGIFDTCGFPKDNFYYYQSWWTDKPVIHVLPHWNWKGREGQNIDVRVFSNCDEVQLFLNGRSLGKKSMKRPSHLSWSVPYEPGTLSAKGYRGNDVIAETKIETSGDPQAIELTADRTQLESSGRDVAVVRVAIKDAQGRIVPTSSNRVTFDIEGPGRILGVGNGDPSCHEPDVFLPQISVQSKPLVNWRWNKIPDPWASSIPETGAQFDDSKWASVDVQAANGPLEAGVAGVFRTTVNVSNAELQTAKIDLWFGKIRGAGVVYVNGNRVGPGFGSMNSTVLDAIHELHAGENTIAVVVNSYAPGSGLVEGAALQIPGVPTLPRWSRSAFNGLAEIIVEAGNTAGHVRIIARSAGLKAGTAELTLLPAP